MDSKELYVKKIVPADTKNCWKKINIKTNMNKTPYESITLKFSMYSCIALFKTNFNIISFD